MRVKGKYAIGMIRMELFVKRTFNDKVISSAARASKRCKIFTPVLLAFAAILIFFHNFIMYFFNNGKRYLAVVICLIFFFVSSSFSFPDSIYEDEIYLLDSTEKNESAGDEIIDTAKADNVESKNVEWIEDSSIYTEDIEKSLSSTDDIETFSLDDFLSGGVINHSYTVDREESSFDKDAWNLVLVNKTHPIPEDYEVPLATISGSMQCDERVLDILLTMLSDARKDGVNLIVCSPYRDYKLQTTLFNRKIDMYMSLGLSYIEAYKTTSQKVTVPGASEHQIGLAFDIVTSGHTTLDYAFADTAAGRWLNEHSKEYGFILRYPRGKEYITGIEFEPWHFRYVGVEAASCIMDNGITLEEFIEDLK